MPTTVTSTGGKRRAHPAVALGLDNDDGPCLGDGEVRTADSDFRIQELLAQIQARDLGQLVRLVGERSAGDRAQEEIADLGAVAVDRRDEDVRRPVAVELQDELGEIRLDRVDAARRERLVQLDLVGRQRLDLHDLGGAVGAGDVEDDRVRLGTVARPVHLATGSQQPPPRTAAGTRRAGPSRLP